MAAVMHQMPFPDGVLPPVPIHCQASGLFPDILPQQTAVQAPGPIHAYLELGAVGREIGDTDIEQSREMIEDILDLGPEYEGQAVMHGLF
jgi:hypothetical protein